MKWELRKRLLLEPPDLKGITDPLWVHCASVGEFNTLKPILQELKRRFPIVLTYFSSKASDYLKAQKGFYDILFPLPLDLPFLIRKFEKLVKPKALIVAEREMWISLISFTRCRKILVNAYARGGLLEKFLVPKFDLIIARTEKDREIFLREGAKGVITCGNLKLVREGEVEPPAIKIEEGFKVIVAGSTHKGEEKIVLRAFTELKEFFPIKLIIAPRHISRSAEVKREAEEFGLEVSLRSEDKDTWDVLIVDTLGELRGFYCLGEVAFVGGTFVPIGGHNLLEPAFCGKPVLFGPHTEKVKDLEEILSKAGYGFRVGSYEELKDTLLNLLKAGFSPKEDIKGLSEKVEECYLKNLLRELE